MGRESYWLRWNRTKRLFRADIADLTLSAGAKLDGRLLLDLESLTDKFCEDAKNLAAEEREAVRVSEEITSFNYEETRRRLDEDGRKRACNVPCPPERMVPRAAKKNAR